MFNVTDTFKVLLPPRHKATLEVDPTLEYISALITEDGVTEMLSARQLCFVPFEMMPLLLGNGLSPRQAFTLIYPWLYSQGLLEACKLLADFVRVSNTKHATLIGNEMPGTGLSAPSRLFQPEVDLELYMERMVLHRNLTGLKSSRIKTTPNHVVPTLRW